MPLYAFTCPECDARRDVYEHTPEDKGARTIVCACGSTMAPVLSVGTGLTWAEEGRPRVIHNLTDQPVVVRSHREHEALMKKHGVTWATERTKTGKGGWV